MGKGRKKGSLDKKPRKRKSFWTNEQLIYLRDNYGTTYNKELASHLNKCHGTICTKAKELGLVKMSFELVTLNLDDIKNSRLSRIKNVTGIYGIYNKVANKIYIGSSTNIRTRLKTHINQLNKGTHHNKELQIDWNNDSSAFVYTIITRCFEVDLLDIEARYIKGWQSETYNAAPTFVKIPRLTKKDIQRIYSKITKTKSCWLLDYCVKKDGYCTIRIDGVEYKAHRVVYKIEKGIDPGDNIVRHLCHNKICCNPKHLKIGSIKQNALDSRVLMFEDRREEIVQTYLETGSVVETVKLLSLEAHYSAVYSLLRRDKRYKRKW